MLALAAASTLADEGTLESQVPTTPPENRYDRISQPDAPLPQRPDEATTRNVDAGKPWWEWSRATDDWGGVRPALDDRGIIVQSSLVYDGTAVLRGGANPRVFASRALLNANVTLDLSRLAGWQGATFFANYQNAEGRDGSADAGAFQSLSSIDARSLNQVSELWFEQRLADDRVRIKLGKIDASTEFAAVPNGAEFMNASMGYSPTIVGFPTYPDGAFGGLISVRFGEHVYLRGGVFDGATQEGVHTGSRGPSTLFGAPADLFLVGEAGVAWSIEHAALPGSLAVGAWRHTGTFDRLDGNGVEHGTDGLYAVLNQTLWRPAGAGADDVRGLLGFVQLGLADAAVSEVDAHVGLGITWVGPLASRPEDAVGVAATWVNFGDAGGDDECIVEAFYKVQLTPFFSIKPDVQYVRHPGGDGSIEDALAAGVRCVIDF